MAATLNTRTKHPVAAPVRLAAPWHTARRAALCGAQVCEISPRPMSVMAWRRGVPKKTTATPKSPPPPFHNHLEASR